MDALVVYESMYGNTALVAEAIGDGLGERGLSVKVVAVDDVDPDIAAGVGLLVAGGPTHAHGMSRKGTRAQAVADITNAFDDPTVGIGLRDWLEGLPEGAGCPAATFDTRFDKPAFLTGSAAKGIAKRMDHRGYQATHVESFFVTTDNTLVEGEEDRARTWGAGLAEVLGPEG